MISLGRRTDPCVVRFSETHDSRARERWRHEPVERAATPCDNRSVVPAVYFEGAVYDASYIDNHPCNGSRCRTRKNAGSGGPRWNDEGQDLQDGAAMPLGEFQEDLHLCESLPMKSKLTTIVFLPKESLRAGQI